MITIWDDSDEHYREFDTNDVEIDGLTLEAHDAQVRADAIERIALKVQGIKDKHNENPRMYPINYGTICGLCADLWEELKEQR